jgi:UDP-GlcNAc:undecaprenyl-phosphate GlcNAc-1-phosphate transferase
VLAASAVEAGALDVQIAGLALAGAALGFLPFNAVRARCFLGDVGSYFIGAWISMLCVVAVDRGVGVLVVGAVMSIYAADTAFTLVRRVRRGEQWWTPHRGHVYQRLTDVGFSHVASASTVSAFTAVVGLIGMFASGSGVLTEVAAGVVIVALCAVYLALPDAIGGRRPARPSVRPTLVDR